MKMIHDDLYTIAPLPTKLGLICAYITAIKLEFTSMKNQHASSKDGAERKNSQTRQDHVISNK